MVPAAATLRVSAAWGLPSLLSDLGVDLEATLDDAGLPRDLFSSRENVISYPQLERLFLTCERRAQCDHVGLLVGERSRLEDMGIAGEMARCGRTVREGIGAFIDHFNLHDTAATCTLFESEKSARFVYSVLQPGMVDTRHFQYGAIAIALNIFQDLCGPDFVPAAVNFASRASTNLRVFQKHFRAPIHFDKEESSLQLTRSWLDTPLPELGTARRAAIGAQARAEYRRMLADFPAVVRRIVRKQLLLGQFTMEQTAAVLSMHRRTLDRHLQGHGVQYGALVESVKEDVARQLLRDTNMPIQQVAETVRFSSAANFATAFRRRVGMTPSAYRRG